MEDGLIYTIVNPPKFMSKSYLKRRLESDGFLPEMFNINIIEKNQMAEEIEIKFTQALVGEKFYSKFNGMKIEENIDIKFEIKKGPSEKKSTPPNTKEIEYADDYATWIDKYYEIKANEEGLVLTNKEELENQKKVIGWLVKKIGKNALQGQSIMNISLPVYIFDRRTMLQVFAYELREFPFILNKVYYIQDPMEKLKYMTTCLISQFHLTPIILKPFNPIIGETFQTKIGNLNCYLEQTAHKPPTASFYCFDDEKLYKIYGFIATTAQTCPNSCKATKVGKFIVEFKDGFQYRFYYPNVHISGITIGKRAFNMKHRGLVIDTKNKITTFIRFNPERKGFIKGLFAKKTEELPDKFIGKIVKTEEVKIDEKGPSHELEKEVNGMSELNGNWTSKLLFDEKIYWRRDLENLCKLYEPEYKLKSDSSYREDLKYWIEKNEQEAQKKKEELEEMQRKDTKLRADYAKKK